MREVSKRIGRLVSDQPVDNDWHDDLDGRQRQSQEPELLFRYACFDQLEEASGLDQEPDLQVSAK